MIEIVEAKPIHIGMIARRLRDWDRREIEAMYGDCRKAIRRIYRGSPVRRAAFVGGEIAALWGFYGTQISPVVYGWIATTPAIEKCPLQFFREVRRGLAEMLQSCSEIRSNVMVTHYQSIRFYEMAGFKAGEPEKLGTKGEMFLPLVMEANRWP